MLEYVKKQSISPVILAIVLMLSGCSNGAHDKKSIPALTQKEQNLINLARASEGSHDISQPLNLYNQAIAMSEGNVDAHMALANFYDRKNMRGEALATMLEAKKLQPHHALINSQLGQFYISEGAGEKALSYLNDGLATHPDDSGLLIGRGTALDMLSRHNEAQESYKSGLLAAETVDINAVHSLAMSYVMSGNYTDAIEVLNTIEPKDKQARLNLAIAYGLAGNQKQSDSLRGTTIPKHEVDDAIDFYKKYHASQAEK
jgi:Flp pilus assembly protein TadD